MASTKTKDPDRLTSAECTARIAEMEARRNEIAPRLAELRGPNAARGAPADAGATGWTPPDILAGAGSVFRRVALEGSPTELVALEAEREVLGAELAQLGFRLDRLRKRLQAAQAEEEKAAAPAVARDAVSALDDALTARADAFHALKAAESRVAALVETVRGARALAGPDAAAMTPEQLRGVWAYPPGRNLKVTRLNELTGISGVGSEFIRDARDLLAPPERRFLDRVRERFAGAPVDEKALSQELAAHRARAIAAGDLSALEDAEAVARDAVAGRRKVNTA